jgi:2-dehydro-3-deoxygalactonokinase
VITLDAGTTNSRAVLWRGDKVLNEVRTSVGVRDTAMSGSNDALARGVTGCMVGVCLKAGIAPEAVDLVVASGMITSSLGLKEVPHLVAPVGLDDLAAGMVSESFPGVWHKPVWFVPGVKNKAGMVSGDELPLMDMMRGEEVETIALQQRLGTHGACWFILPGSHTKFVRLSKNGRIMQIVSTLAGEMMDALSHNTILAASVEPGSGMNPKWLLKGYRVSVEQGLSRAAYCVRLAQLWSESSKADRTSYLLGVLLGSDIIALKACGAAKDTIYVAGREELREAFVTLLNADGGFRDVHPIDPALLKDLAGWGALLAARRRGLASGE